MVAPALGILRSTIFLLAEPANGSHISSVPPTSRIRGWSENEKTEPNRRMRLIRKDFWTLARRSAMLIFASFYIFVADAWHETRGSDNHIYQLRDLSPSCQ